jgi:hypothetical protein
MADISGKTLPHPAVRIEVRVFDRVYPIVASGIDKKNMKEVVALE